MADLLGQLFAYTEVFDMADAARAAAAAEDHGGGGGRGALARSRAQHLDRGRAHRARVGRDRTSAWPAACSEAGEGAELFGKVVAEVPRLLERAESTALALADMARGGLRLDDETVERLAAAQARHNRWTRWALWIGALALVAIAVWLVLPVG